MSFHTIMLLAVTIGTVYHISQSVFNPPKSFLGLLFHIFSAIGALLFMTAAIILYAEKVEEKQPLKDIYKEQQTILKEKINSEQVELKRLDSMINYLDTTKTLK